MSENPRHRGSQFTHQPPDNAAAQLQTSDTMNIVLLGKTGVGKSSTGNTILGENAFPCKRSLCPVTQVSNRKSKVIDGKNVCVIDTPGFFGTSHSKEQLAMEFARSVYLSAPGVHAFLFVVPFGRFTEQEAEVLMKVQKVFGKNVLKHVIILFTYGDECDQEIFDSEIQQNKVVKNVIDSCQGYLIFNNKDVINSVQVTELLRKIDEMNPNGYYTNEMYEWAQKYAFERFWHYLSAFFIAVIDLFKKSGTNFDVAKPLQRARTTFSCAYSPLVD